MSAILAFLSDLLWWWFLASMTFCVGLGALLVGVWLWELVFPAPRRNVWGEPIRVTPRPGPIRVRGEVPRSLTHRDEWFACQLDEIRSLPTVEPTRRVR